MKWKEPKQLSDVSLYPELIICEAYQFTLLLKTSNWVRLDTKKMKRKKENDRFIDYLHLSQWNTDRKSLFTDHTIYF